MNDILIPFMGVIAGLGIIAYGVTRTELNFNIYKDILNRNIKIDNKKAFLSTSKICFSIIGFLVLISGFLVSNQVLSQRNESFYFLSILVFQLITRQLIQFKYCKKSSKVRDI